MLEPLLIDIETILKMIRFVESFKTEFLNNKYLTDVDHLHINRYIENANILSKEHLWGFCCVDQHIKEINIIITNWRKKTPDYAKIEIDVFKMVEKEFSHDIIGKIIKIDNKNKKFKKLLKEIKNSRFYYNSLAILPSKVINNGEISRLILFY
jgi:hypothetical protein